MKQLASSIAPADLGSSGHQALRALIVASPPLRGPGGVEAVCRAITQVLSNVGVETTHLAGTDLWFSSMAAHVPGGKHWRGLGEALLLARATRCLEEFDLVVTNGPVGWGVRGGKALHFYHGTYVAQAKAVRSEIRARGYLKMRHLDGMVLERMAGRGKVCLANSATTAEEVRSQFGYDCTLVWCPVDTESFCPGERDERLLERLGLSNDRPVGLFIGTDRPSKGPGVAYEVMKRMVEMDWLALGDTNSAVVPELQHVRHRSRLAPHELPVLYRSVDLLLVTSLYEPFSVSSAEALGCGTPVVSVPTGATDLLMSDPPLSAFRVDNVNDVSAIVAGVKSVLENPEGARSAAYEGGQRVRSYLGYEAWGKRFLAAAGLQ